MKNKHVFDQSVSSLRYMALGDSAVRIIGIHSIIQQYNLDAIVIPHNSASLLPLWKRALGDIVQSVVPKTHRHATISAPTSLDFGYGSAGFNVFESVYWENGFFDTPKMRVNPPCLFRCDKSSRSVMIYPTEHTDGNRVYDSDFWIKTATKIRELGYKINLLGDRNNKLEKFFTTVSIDRHFPPNLDGLEACIAASSCAVGASTGPTWICLLSDIPQVVLESKRSPHGYWNFDRCQRVLIKKLAISESVETVLG